MSLVRKNFLLLLFLSLGLWTISACSSSSQEGQNDSGNNEDNPAAFENRVNNFDSTWKERIEALDVSIHQWDSASEGYKSSLKDRMQNQLEIAREKRDSLQDILDQIDDQTQDTWKDFRHSVREKYSEVNDAVSKVSDMLK